MHGAPPVMANTARDQQKYQTGNGPERPFRVISTVLTVVRPFQLYPDQRTSSDRPGMSQKFQFQTHAQRHRSSYSITLSAVASRFSGTLIEGMLHRSELAQETSRPFRAQGKRV